MVHFYPYYLTPNPHPCLSWSLLPHFSRPNRTSPRHNITPSLLPNSKAILFWILKIYHPSPFLIPHSSNSLSPQPTQTSNHPPTFLLHTTLFISHLMPLFSHSNNSVFPTAITRPLQQHLAWFKFLTIFPSLAIFSLIS